MSPVISGRIVMGTSDSPRKLRSLYLNQVRPTQLNIFLLTLLIDTALGVPKMKFIFLIPVVLCNKS